MKRIKTITALTLLVSVFLASCSTQLSMQKRRYSEGYNLETVKANKETAAPVSEAKTAAAAKEIAKPVSAVSKSQYQLDDKAVDEAFAKAENISPEFEKAIIADENKVSQLNSINKGKNLFETEKKIARRKNADYVWEMNSSAMDNHTLAIVGLALGIASVVGFMCLTGIPGIFVNLKAKKSPDKDDQTFALIGLICSIIGTIIGLLVVGYWIFVVALVSSSAGCW